MYYDNNKFLRKSGVPLVPTPNNACTSKDEKNNTIDSESEIVVDPMQLNDELTTIDPETPVAFISKIVTRSNYKRTLTNDQNQYETLQ